MLSVNWSDKPVNFLGMEIKLKAGEMATTQRILARRWQWSVSKVNYFIREKKLNTLVNTFMNTCLNTPITKITVNNWNKYQSGIERLPERLPEHLTEREQEETILKKKLYQRKKKEIDKTISITATEKFNLFWEQYPKRNNRKVGKKECFDLWKKLKPTDYDLILIAVKNYADSNDAKRNFAVDPKRFFKKDLWRDWIEEVIEDHGEPGLAGEAYGGIDHEV